MIANTDVIKDNNFPDIYVNNPDNPTITSPNSTHSISFNQTFESLIDIDSYRSFVSSAVRQFRSSRTYTQYKGFLMGLGLDRCQIHSNIVHGEMAEVEMHHHIITIYDIAVIISEHMIATQGQFNSMRLIHLLKKAHKEHKIPLVMLSQTPHQINHNTDNKDFFIHPDQCIGDWFSFLEEYKCGIKLDIAYKILQYINRSIELSESNHAGLLDIRESILRWVDYNTKI